MPDKAKASSKPRTAGNPRRSPPKAATTSIPLRKDPPAADPSDRQVVLAAITGAHGLGGEVKLKLFTDDLSRYQSFNGGALSLKSLRGQIARFAEVPDRTAAEALRGTELTVPRSALPPLAEGEYYHADLIGLPVVSTAGEMLGQVVLVENFGAGDVLEIERGDGARFMVPMRTEAVPEWNSERLVVDAGFVS
jgi:16S rRNA processing protein RimM